MKVALLVDALARRGGVEGYLGDLARYLVQRGDEVTLICARQAGAAEVRPWRVQVLPVRAATRSARLRAWARAAGALARAGSYDVTLAVRHAGAAHLYQPHGGLVQAAARARRGRLDARALRSARRVWSALSPRERTFAALERGLIRAAARIVAISALLEQEVADYYPAASGRVVRLPLGVDLERFHPEGERAEPRANLGIPAGAPLLLFAGFNTALKGLAWARRALHERSELREAHLLVCGPARIESAGVPRGRVHLLGPVEEMAPLYRAADALLHPTFYDPCSLVVLEALACGCPAVTTAGNGAAEVGGEALAIARDPRDLEGLAGGVLRLLAGGAKLRSAARRSVEQRSQREHFARLRRLFEEVAGPLPPRG